jgi:hypothetical protein
MMMCDPLGVVYTRDLDYPRVKTRGYHRVTSSRSRCDPIGDKREMQDLEVVPVRPDWR